MASKGIWIGIVVIVIIGIIGILFFTLYGPGTSLDDKGINDYTESENVDWMSYELKDVRTGQTFSINDFVGKSILLESFAVWCPTCTKQQNEVKKLHEEIGDDFVSISIDTDASEDEARVLEHIESNGFEWYYAISPIELTQSLIDEFGNSIVSAPIAPMVLICEDQSFRKLGSLGSRSPEKLKEEIANGCN
jgi:cytochrome oxidase Cu insertion factor (SCO1/SenC/PrrC family)